MNSYLRAQQLRKKAAKFPFVKIGTQYWTTKNFDGTTTPQGTLIPKMQANGNVEKITNIADREFSSDTGWWGKWANAVISNSKLNLTGNDAQIYKGGFISLRYYKITFTIDFISGGSVKVRNPGAVFTYNSIGTFTEYVQCNGTEIGLTSIGSSTTATIDNISIQEIGWSGSQELYDGIYAQTTGTVEQKTYAAVKAAAMWCHYNNDVAIGAVYGKLYNWFAVKLLQMDIDYYNAANPTALWGWRVPTINNYLVFNDSLINDIGIKLSVSGFTYWNNLNVGNNSSGFSLLGSGRRDSNGTYLGICFFTYMRSITDSIYGKNSENVNMSAVNNWSNMDGFSLRLIKS